MSKLLVSVHILILNEGRVRLEYTAASMRKTQCLLCVIGVAVFMTSALSYLKKKEF